MDDTAVQQMPGTPSQEGGWSWGGSFQFIWGPAIAGKWGLFAGMLVSMIIPLVNFIAIIVWFIYGGLNGKKMIYSSPRFTNQSEKDGAYKAYETIGKVTAIFALIGFVIWLLMFLFLGGMLRGLYSGFGV